MTTFRITSQAGVRAAFWSYAADHNVGPRRRKPGKDHPVDVRVAFCDYIDMLARDGTISEALASRVTL